MDIYNDLLDALNHKYVTLKVLKVSERGCVSAVRHRRSGTRYVFRQFEGNSAVYQRLLTVSCPNLPQIYEVGERDGKTAVLEEYIQGDTLAFLLAGDVLTAKEAKNITMQLCSALWVLHSMGAVHRLYAIYGTYSAMAYETGRHPSTVARYIKMENVPNNIRLTVQNLLQSA